MSSRILLFTGDGKGKTTAAMGMALRAWGQGEKVMVVQFVKNFQDTGEFKAINRLDGIDIVQLGLGFPPSDKSGLEFEKHKQKCSEALSYVSEVLCKKESGLIVLDEICFAVSAGLIEENKVLEIIKAAPDNLIIALTGRGATSGLIELADTVTEMKSLKHGYESGIKAQLGVEY